MVRGWYLVKVDLEASESLNTYCALLGIFYRYFLVKYSLDASKSDDVSRW